MAKLKRKPPPRKRLIFNFDGSKQKTKYSSKLIYHWNKRVARRAKFHGTMLLQNKKDTFFKKAS